MYPVCLFYAPKFVCLFVCLFRAFHPTRKFCHLYGDVTITGEGLRILTYTRHLWLLSSEGSVECHIYCYIGHPFIMVISDRGPVTLAPVSEHLAVELTLPVLTTYVCRDWDSNTKPFACGMNALTNCTTASARPEVMKIIFAF